jgi:hypothetical protein
LGHNFVKKLQMDKEEENRARQTVFLSKHPEVLQVPMIGQSYSWE